MLTYYHGTTKSDAEAILNNGIDLSMGSGELGQGFYVGSSLWRAYSWAWSKARTREYRVIEFQIDEKQLNELNLLCKNRRSTQDLFARLQEKYTAREYRSGCDAIWAPIVGKDIQNVYQIKFENSKGIGILQQKKILELPNFSAPNFTNIASSESVKLLFPTFKRGIYSDLSQKYSGIGVFAIVRQQNPQKKLSIQAVYSGQLISVDLIYMPNHFYRAQVKDIGVFYFMIEKPRDVFMNIDCQKVPLSVLTPVNEDDFNRACREHHFFFVGE